MKKKRKATKSTPVKDLNEEESLMHYNAVMAEELRSQMKLLMETVDGRMSTFEQKIDGLRNEMNARFEIVEAAIKVNGQRITNVEAEIQQMEGRLSKKIDTITKRIDNHEDRISPLEQAQT
jgi:chromosome segregation ATPase